MRILFFLFILLSADKSCTQTTSIPFIKATSQAYSGGAAGSGYGTYYTIYLKLPSNTEIRFDSLWVGERRLPVSIKEKESVNDTLVLFANDFRMHHFPNDNRKLPEDPAPVAYPIKSNAQGILGYIYNGKRQYFPVETWIKLKAIAYP